MCDIRVSFAFLTPTSLEYCINSNLSTPDACTSRRDVLDVSDFVDEHVVLLKLLDFEANCTRVFRTSFPRNAAMGQLYDVLRRNEGSKDADFICFELAALPSSDTTRLVISRVLSRGDAMPHIVFCQRVDRSLSSGLARTRWVAVNTLVCGVDGEIFPAHVPFVAPLATENISKADLLASIARVLCLGSEWVERLHDCVVVACRFDGRRLTLDEPLVDGSLTEQVAILYNSVDVGDVVVVAAQWHERASRGQMPMVQGVVTRRFAQNGITFYDVKEVNTGVVVEKVPCVQLFLL